MRIKNRVKPIYAVAALWIAWAWLLPLSGFWSYAALIALSIFISKRLKKKYPAGADEEQERQNAFEAGYRDGYQGTEEDHVRASYNKRTGGSYDSRNAARAQQANAEERIRKAERETLRAREEAAEANRRAKRAEEDADARIKAERRARADEDARRAAEEAARQAEQEAIAQGRKRPRVGDKAIDQMLDDEEKAIAELKRLDDAIPDEKLSAQIVHLEDVTTKIVNFIVAHPDKKGQVRKFFTYYLPTTIKFLNAYDRMDDTGISGINIDGTKGNIEKMMDTLLMAFDKQLDALYADEALDISTDIKVMESMLAQEGLAGDNVLRL